MKTWIFSMCMGMFCLISAQDYAQSYAFKINGTLKNISPMPDKMYLKSIIPGVLQKDSDSTPVINGQYSFQGVLNVDEAIMVQISTEPKMTKTNGYAIFIDKGELDVVSDGTPGKVSVAGTAANAQLEADGIKNGVEKEKSELEQITKTEEYKSDTQLQADVYKRSQRLQVKGLVDMYSFVKNNPEKRSSPMYTYFLEAIFPNGNPGLDSVLSLLPQHVKNDALGKAITRVRLLKDSVNKVASAKNKVDEGKVPMGKMAPDFTQPDVNNKIVSLSSFRGKYVLVDFWASWCAPCRAENPNVVKAYNNYKDKGFTVLGVSLDAEASRSAWLKAIAADGLKWTEVADLKGWKNEAAIAYGVSAIPQNFLIDPNGVVIAKNLRGDELNAKLASLFK